MNITKRRVCYCPHCEKLLMSQHPLNSEGWIRPDGRLPQFPGGFCTFCGKEYNFDENPQFIRLLDTDSPQENPINPPEKPAIADTSKAYKKPEKRLQKAQPPKNTRKYPENPGKPRKIPVNAGAGLKEHPQRQKQSIRPHNHKPILRINQL